MPTVKFVAEDDPDPLVQQVFADIKATKKIDFIPAIWRALATHPQHLELCWTQVVLFIPKITNTLGCLLCELFSTAIEQNRTLRVFWSGVLKAHH
jgi:hypothetical protein